MKKYFFVVLVVFVWLFCCIVYAWIDVPLNQGWSHAKDDRWYGPKSPPPENKRVITASYAWGFTGGWWWLCSEGSEHVPDREPSPYEARTIEYDIN